MAGSARSAVADVMRRRTSAVEPRAHGIGGRAAAIDTVYYNRYGKTMADELFKPKEASTVNPNDPGIVRAAERAADFVRKSVHKIEEVLDINNVADFEKTLLRLCRHCVVDPVGPTAVAASSALTRDPLEVSTVAAFGFLARPRADALAYALHENKRRWFQIKRHTDTHIITLLTHRSKKEIRYVRGGASQLGQAPAEGATVLA